MDSTPNNTTTDSASTAGDSEGAASLPLPTVQEALLSALQKNFTDLHFSLTPEKSHVVCQFTHSGAGSLEFFTKLQSTTGLDFNFLVDVTAVDYMDSRDSRFEVVYHLLSLNHNHRLRVKIAVDESSCSVPSVVSLWPGANFLEREVWDMFGIKFEGHPDLRRILMYDEFKGHPLRKDYPVQLKQPRVTLRAPEVENTARQMRRPDLVSITKKKVS